MKASWNFKMAMIGFFFTTAAPVHASSLGIHPTDSNALLAKRLSTIEVVSNSLNKMELYYDQFWHPYDTWRIQVTLVGTLAMTKDLDTLLQSNFRGSENELASLYFSTILNRFDKTRRFSEKRFSADMSDEGEAQLIKVEFWLQPLSAVEALRELIEPLKMYYTWLKVDFLVKPVSH